MTDTAMTTPSREEMLAISKARAANMRDLAGDLEVARDGYLSAMESQNADAMADRREVMERILWDDKGLIIDALRLASPADEVREATIAECVEIAKSPGGHVSCDDPKMLALINEWRQSERADIVRRISALSKATP